MNKIIPIIRAATESDIESIMGLFTRYIDNSFFPGLGENFMKTFPAALVQSPAAVNFVCTVDSRVVGFISGLYDSSSFSKEIVRRKWVSLLRVIACSFLRRPAIMRDFLEGFLYARRAMRDPVKAELLYIAIEPDFRSQGAAARLIEHALEEMKQRGAPKVRVSTDQSNTAVNRLLLKIGFEREDSFRLFGKRMYLYRRIAGRL